MRLSSIAKYSIFSVKADDPLDKAICLMEEHQIHHLPVLENGRVVGMLSDRDLLISVGWKLEIERVVRGRTSRTVGPKYIREVMSSPPVCLEPESDIHTAARLMATGKFHAAPLVHKGALSGLVTSIDLLSAFCGAKEQTPIPARLSDSVRRHMRVKVHTVGPHEPLHVVARILKELNIRHLPITADEILIGIISDRDIRRTCGVEMIEDEQAEAAGKAYFGPTTVLQVMTRKVNTVSATATMLDVLRIMTEFHLGCVPVTDGVKLVGLLTETDMLRFVAQIDEEQG